MKPDSPEFQMRVDSQHKVRQCFVALGVCVHQSQKSFNPLTPKSDQHLISPNKITPESNVKVMRIKEVITN